MVYDAAAAGDTITYATLEGLSIATATERKDLIASGAIRFATAPVG